MASNFLRVAEILLRRSAEARTSRQLVDDAIKDRLIGDELAGKTPWQTMQARLSEEIRRNGQNSRFVRVRPGHYQLREKADTVYDARPFRPPRPKERALVVPRDTFYTFADFQGIKTSWRQLHRRLLDPSVCKYMDRYQAEQDDDHKQILTYVMVTSGDQVLTYTRGTYNRVEEYLRGSRCIGFGGHVNEGDLSLLNHNTDLGVVESAVRELTEELTFPPREHSRLAAAARSPKIVGILNDDSSAVGRRHLAFVLQYEVQSAREWENPKRGERSITRLKWLSPNSSEFSLDRFEYWSQLCLREFYKPLVNEQPSFQIRRRNAFVRNHVLCVVGPIGSGKTQTTEVLVSDFGYTEVNSGRVLARLLNLPPVSASNRTRFQEAAQRFITTDAGPEKLGRALADAIALREGEPAVVDGIRHRATLAALRRNLAPNSVAVVFVQTPPDVAYKFYKARLREDVSFHEFTTSRENPVERETNDLIAEADAVLYNWSGRDSYRKTVHDLMKQLGRGSR
jgi:predicted NUDIX family phosphoesterase/dephospho-CoA kinase